MPKNVCLVDPGNEIVYGVAGPDSQPYSSQRSYWIYAVNKHWAWWIVPLRDDVTQAALEDPGDMYHWYGQLLPWMDAELATPLEAVSFTTAGHKISGHALVQRGSEDVAINFRPHAEHFDTWDIDEPEEGMEAIVRVEIPADVVDRWQTKYPPSYPRDPRWSAARLIPHAILVVPYREVRQYVVEDEDEYSDEDEYEDELGDD